LRRLYPLSHNIKFFDFASTPACVVEIDLKWLKGKGLYKKEAITMNITQFPPEIICHIGDFLGVQKVSLALTCKQFNETLKKDTKKIKKELKEIKESKTCFLIRPHPHPSSTIIFSFGCFQ
jgi:hypothetical protein